MQPTNLKSKSASHQSTRATDHICLAHQSLSFHSHMSLKVFALHSHQSKLESQAYLDFTLYPMDKALRTPCFLLAGKEMF